MVEKASNYSSQQLPSILTPLPVVLAHVFLLTKKPINSKLKKPTVLNPPELLQPKILKNSNERSWFFFLKGTGFSNCFINVFGSMLEFGGSCAGTKLQKTRSQEIFSMEQYHGFTIVRHKLVQYITNYSLRQFVCERDNLTHNF